MSLRVLENEARPFIGNYRAGDVIGKGGYGTVFKCSVVAEPHKVYACKMLLKCRMKSQAAVDEVRREIECMRRTGSHPCVVGLIEACEDETAVYIVMDLCPGGELFEELEGSGAYTEFEACVIFSQLISAVRFCHKNGIVHRDLKPENVLFCGNKSNFHRRVELKIADFGLAIRSNGKKFKGGYLGSKFYMAPEMWLGLESDYKVDVWSLGIVLCTILTGNLPFFPEKGKGDKGLKDAIIKGQVDFSHPSWHGVSAEAISLVKRMLQVDAAVRPSISEVMDHPWISRSEKLLGEFLQSHVSGTGGDMDSLVGQCLKWQKAKLRAVHSSQEGQGMLQSLHLSDEALPMTLPLPTSEYASEHSNSDYLGELDGCNPPYLEPEGTQSSSCNHNPEAVSETSYSCFQDFKEIDLSAKQNVQNLQPPGLAQMSSAQQNVLVTTSPLGHLTFVKVENCDQCTWPMTFSQTSYCL